MDEYRALGPIEINSVRAFNKGDLVPEGHVEAFGLADQVEKVGDEPAPPEASTEPADEPSAEETKPRLRKTTS